MLYIKIKTAAIHFCVTLIVALFCALLVFYVWYPWPFYEMLGGHELFILVIVCDLVLGPLMTMVIFDPGKSRRALWFDYFVVGVVQVAAFVYGLHTVAITRPIYVVLAGDGVEVVVADQVDEADLAQAADDRWRTPSWRGPVYAWAAMPADPKERSEIVWRALDGKDIQFLPQYFRDWAAGGGVFVEKVGSIESLIGKHAFRADEIKRSVQLSGWEQNDLGWLPVRHFKGFWTVLVDRQSMRPVAWLNLDPY